MAFVQGKRKLVESNPLRVASAVPAGSEKTASLESLATTPEYDFVVLGGGTAGCVVGSRLSENPNHRVLILEAGESGMANLYSRMPAGTPLMFDTPADWALTTTPQKGIKGRALQYPRGRLLGGCSSINAQIMQYSATEDCDEWAKIIGNDQWSWQKLQPYFKKFENFVEHKEFNVPQDHPERGQGGPLTTGFMGHFSGWARKFIDGCVELGIKKFDDFNTSAGTMGVAKAMTFIYPNGVRCSSESGYLSDKVLRERKNLTVLTGAHITRILFEKGSSGQPRAIGVEFASGPRRQLFRVRVAKEAIVSAGTTHTPHLLMISGVGSAVHLSSKGVPVVHDLPGVGQHMQDHVMANMRFRVKPNLSLTYLTLKGWRQLFTLGALFEWLFKGTGPMTTNVAESYAFLRSDDERYFPKSKFPLAIEDTTSGPGAPDLEFYASPAAWWQQARVPVQVPGSSDLSTLAVVLLRPSSKGSITLASNDPFAPPVVDPNYLSTEHDRELLRRGIRFIGRLADTNAMRSTLIVSETEPGLDHQINGFTDAKVDQIIDERAETVYHPTSTARMAPLADRGVVDANLKVYGIENLRVIDASVMPSLSSGHPVAQIFAIAEKGSEIIAKQYA